MVTIVSYHGSWRQTIDTSDIYRIQSKCIKVWLHLGRKCDTSRAGLGLD